MTGGLTPKAKGNAALAELGWITYAACSGKDPELFYREDRAGQAEAKEICMGCPVLQLCRARADQLEGRHGFAWGVWGGETRLERLRRRRTSQTSFGDPGHDEHPGG